LEAFVADYQRQVEGLPLPAHLPSTGKQVAVIGSGPAGLTCAEQLALLGHSVSIYEMRERPGGMLVYTIPAFRLPAGIVQDKVVQLQRMGVRFVTGTRLGKDFQVADLWRDGNQAIFLASGAGFEPTAQVPGEDLNAVYRATEFLLHLNMEGATRINLSGASVAVFGSGHAAIDCGRAAVRLGASKVTCYLPESEKQATWRVEDQLAAEEEGVEFVPCTRLVKLFGDEQNNLSGLRCQLDLASIPADQRPTGRQPSGLFMVRADLAILAPERGPDPLISGLCPGLEVSPEGWILQDAESGKTSLKGVFAAGDNTGKQHLAAVAIAQARKVAGCIHEYLMEG
jgi:glutamate synthase (NADPH/NADH) small chain